jgi:enolase
MIKNIILSEIYNSCKEKTIQISIKTENGTFSASPPSGTSTGGYEAKTLNVKIIKKNFPKIKKRFIGRREVEVDRIIEKMGIERIGANFSIALSIAAIRAASRNNTYNFLNPHAKTFPFPLGNAMGGGAHSGYLSEQEFLILPVRAKSIKEAKETNLSIWKEINYYLKPFIVGRNRENAWMCKLNDLKSLEYLANIAGEFEARIGIDFAANNIYKNGRYYYNHPDRNFSAEDQLEFVLDLIRTYKLAYVEDPFHENDLKHFAELTRKVKCLVTGDDVFATQPYRLKLGIRERVCNSIIIKPNQAGSVYKTLETVRIAKKARYATIVSHRSCETNDSFIADLAVGTSSPIIKCGIFGKEREAKLDRLVEIWNNVENPKMTKLNFHYVI